ncbi:UNVERIFIED_CONTAM: Sodium/proton antiporter 1 [Sesamum calycinum]|uniref:Sodium/proton antiporter 1 n=1 Tax=Sesamum calycinum TaxID=2727403 RepID=A0AAW2PPF5_9LAMI
MSAALPHPFKIHLDHSSSHKFKKCPTSPPPLLLHSSSWLKQGDGPRFLLHRNGLLLARAEDKARGSSSTSSTLSQFDSDNQLQDVSPSGTCDPLCSVDETSSEDFEASYQPKTDFLKALAVLAAAGTGALAINHSWVAANQAPSTEAAVSELSHASGEVSEIVFFLLGAMTIVEIVDAHQGFKLVTDNITTRKPRTLLWVVGFVTFFLSSVLDNLTSTIVMVSLLRKLVPPSEYRKLLGAVVVIAANAGGAWTPIGDVTTTMLWIHGQISTLQTMKDLAIPSAVSLAVPLALMSLTSEVNGKGQNSADVLASEQMAPRGKLVFSIGIGALVFVPVFKALTGLPPYMGMLLGLGVLWIVTDAIHYGESERQRLKVPQALSRIDTQGALFFLGILLSVSSFTSQPRGSRYSAEIANYLDAHIANVELIASSIGVVSAIIDNVPLVAATMGMYDLSSFPQDSEFWQLVAYCAGTGGSMLVIGSAAGVAFMGMEKVDFFVSGALLALLLYMLHMAVHNLNISLPTALAQVPFLSGS